MRTVKDEVGRCKTFRDQNATQILGCGCGTGLGRRWVHHPMRLASRKGLRGLRTSSPAIVSFASIQVFANSSCGERGLDGSVRGLLLDISEA